MIGDFAEVAAFIAAPGVAVFEELRQRNADAGFVLRQAHVLMRDGAGSLQIVIRAVEHLLCAAARTGIAEENIADFLHGRRSGFFDIQIGGNAENFRAGLLHLFLIPGQQFVERNAQALLQKIPVSFLWHGNPD